MPPRRFRGGRKYELTTEGVSKRFPTRVQLANRRWALKRMISENEEHVAEITRRLRVQVEELRLVHQLEEVREEEKKRKEKEGADEGGKI